MNLVVGRGVPAEPASGAGGYVERLSRRLRPTSLRDSWSQGAIPESWTLSMNHTRKGSMIPETSDGRLAGAPKVRPATSPGPACPSLG
jgi:hypothetical protein